LETCIVGDLLVVAEFVLFLLSTGVIVDGRDGLVKSVNLLSLIDDIVRRCALLVIRSKQRCEVVPRVGGIKGRARGAFKHFESAICGRAVDELFALIAPVLAVSGELDGDGGGQGSHGCGVYRLAAHGRYRVCERELVVVKAIKRAQVGMER
jgi:hypothetical protein